MPEQGADAVHIAEHIGRSTRALLRCHVRQRSDDAGSHGCGGVTHVSRAEVGEVCGVRSIEQDVGGLDVTVQNPPTMRFGQRGEHGTRDLDGPRR